MHNPQRYENESQADYKARRLMAKQAVRQITAYAINKGLENSRKVQRDAMRASGTMGKRTRAYVALMAAWAAKRVPNWEGHRDEHGAVTLVGRTYNADGTQNRRTWLAGVSARRGY